MQPSRPRRVEAVGVRRDPVVDVERSEQVDLAGAGLDGSEARTPGGRGHRDARGPSPGADARRRSGSEPGRAEGATPVVLHEYQAC